MSDFRNSAPPVGAPPFEKTWLSFYKPRKYIQRPFQLPDDDELHPSLLMSGDQSPPVEDKQQNEAPGLVPAYGEDDSFEEIKVPSLGLAGVETDVKINEEIPIPSLAHVGFDSSIKIVEESPIPAVISSSFDSSIKIVEESPIPAVISSSLKIVEESPIPTIISSSFGSSTKIVEENPIPTIISSRDEESVRESFYPAEIPISVPTTNRDSDISEKICKEPERYRDVSSSKRKHAHKPGKEIKREKVHHRKSSKERKSRERASDDSDVDSYPKHAERNKRSEESNVELGHMISKMKSLKNVSGSSRVSVPEKIKTKKVRQVPESDVVEETPKLSQLKGGAASKGYEAIVSKKKKSDEEDDYETSLKEYENLQKSRLVHYSDSNDSSDSDKSRSDSRPDSKPVKAEVKVETDFGEDGYYGSESYYCTVCQLNLNSECTYRSHMVGKKHRKALNAQKIPEIAKAGLINALQTQEASYQFKTAIAPNTRQMVLSLRSEIQNEAERHSSGPVPGLNFIVENRTNLKEITYYCELCDAKCAPPSILPHLIGFKHHLSFIKEIDPAYYEYNKDKPKNAIKNRVKEMLLKHERRHGRGQIKVIKEVPIDSTPSFSEPGPSWRDPGMPQDMKPEMERGQYGPVLPSTLEDYLDTSKNDFHCTLCDSHMNNVQMWESHIIGKRHAKNLKKNPGADLNSWPKSQPLKAPPHIRSKLERSLERYQDDVIVGLDFIRETQGENGVLYHCYLCGAGCTSDIIDHLLMLKHRIKYLEKVDSTGEAKNAIVSISQLDISLTYRETLVLQECARIEREHGRGKVEIYLNKH